MTAGLRSAVGFTIVLLVAGCTSAPLRDDGRAALGCHDESRSERPEVTLVRAAAPDANEPASGTELTLLPALVAAPRTRTEAAPPRSSDRDGHMPGALSIVAVDHNRCDFSWASDKADLWSDFRADLDAIATRQNAIALLAAGGASFAFHQSIDDDIARDTARHANRWGNGDDFFSTIGHPALHAAAAGGLYLYGLWQDDAEAHDVGKSLLHALAITDANTIIMKAAANTTRPDGSSGGWPSGHVSSSFAVASVLDEFYGHHVGVPAYLFAGLVGWARIDDRRHDLSDVVFGAALGYVIGHAVAGEHHARLWGMEVEPFSDFESAATGIALQRRF